MKRLLLILPVALAAIPLGGAYAGPTSSDATTRTVCHRTTSTSTPYRKIRVTAAQYRAHLRHAADIVPAPAGACPRTILRAVSGGTALTTNLVGETESPTGDPVGTGTATIRLRRNQGQVCYRLSVRNIKLPSAGAHIHVGGPGSAGAIVVPLGTPAGTGTASGCARASRGVVNAILRNRSAYYVNVHTTDFPAGAVRGQLGGAQADLGWVVSVPMTGAQEPNNSGDPDGTGTAVVRLRRADSLACFRLTVANITLPSVGAHIHRGPRGSNGPIVIPFEAPGTSGESRGCVTAAQSLLDEIANNPAGFYVNVHTTDHRGGAVRGQLG